MTMFNLTEDERRRLALGIVQGVVTGVVLFAALYLYNKAGGPKVV